MADGREKQQEAQNKSDSTSMKGQTSDSGTRDSSDRRTDRRHETRGRSGAQILGSGLSGTMRSDRRHGTEPENRGDRYSGVRINEPRQTRDHRESDIQQQQGPRDTLVDIQRRSSEKDSRLTQQQRASTQYYGGRGSGSQRRSDDRSPLRHEVALSSVYPVLPGVLDCPHYLRDGWCRFRGNCRFNHPRVDCKFFLEGYCQFGSRCRNIHPLKSDGAQPIRQEKPENSGVNDLGQYLQEEAAKSERKRRDMEMQREEADRKRKRELEKAQRDNRRRLDEVPKTVEFNDGKGVEDELANLSGKRIRRK